MIVTWLCWLWLIIIDFPQTLSLGHDGYGKLSLIFLRFCYLVMLVMGNYHWFPSDFVTWSCWFWEIIIDFLQTLSLGYWFPFDFVTWSSWLWLLIIDSPKTWSSWSCWLWEIIIDFPQTLSLGHIGYGKLSLFSFILCHVVTKWQSRREINNQVTKSEGNQW
jgi:hypothetical protein